MSIGEQIITEIVKQGMVQEVYPKGGADTTAVFVWKQNAAEQLDALVAQKECCCMWQENDGGCYGTGCNNAFELTWGTPKANNFKFCPFCGKTINTE